MKEYIFMKANYSFKIVATFFILTCLTGLQAVKAQNNSELTELKRVFYTELAKSLSKDKLPQEDAVEFSRVAESGVNKYNLQGKPFDAFYIKATDKKIFIASTSFGGIQNGIFWYLHQLGFRYYFPHENWHFFPKLNTPFKPLEKNVSPSFLHRRIWYAYGTGSKKADADYRFWFRANLQGGEQVNVGHAYDGIVRRNRQAFLDHPEYFAQKVAKGKIPGNPKFNVDNPGLIDLCIRDAFNQIEDYRKKTGNLPNMISMDPSDGGGYSTSKTGGPNEQVFYLANKVAGAVLEKYKTVKVGLYAYNFHANPPSFSLMPNVVVLIATAMAKSNYRTEELVSLWKSKNIKLGIRDYFGVLAWDWDMPGRPAGGKISYVSRLKEYYTSGIQFFSAETNIGWISRGLGHYIASQLLWDVNKDAASIKNEFYKNLFGNAAGYMGELFDSWQQGAQPVPLEGNLLEWYELIGKAEKSERDEDVQRRITDIKQHLHFVTLYKKWLKEATDNNFISMLNYAYRVQDKGIVASYPYFKRLANTAVKGKVNMRFDDPQALWKKNKSIVSNEETQADFQNDINSFNKEEKISNIEMPEKFAVRGVLSSTASRQAAGPSKQVRLRGTHAVLFQINDQYSDAAIYIQGGLVKTRKKKPLNIKVYEYRTDLALEEASLVLTRQIQPDKQEMISLSDLKKGFYILQVEDYMNGFSLRFSKSVAFSLLAGNGRAVRTYSRNNLFMYVDKEVREFKLLNEGVMTLYSPKGRIIDLQKKKGLITIKVNPDEIGIWQIKNQNGYFTVSGLLPLVSPENKLLTLSQ